MVGCDMTSQESRVPDWLMPMVGYVAISFSCMFSFRPSRNDLVCDVMNSDF